MAKDSKGSAPKELAGVLVASIIVIAYIAIGFVSIAATMFFAIEVKPPIEWSSAMLSLASAALGFLIGKSSPVGSVLDVNSTAGLARLDPTELRSHDPVANSSDFVGGKPLVPPPFNPTPRKKE